MPQLVKVLSEVDEVPRGASPTWRTTALLLWKNLLLSVTCLFIRF